MTVEYEQVKQDFLSGKIKGCKTFFEKNEYFVEAGYCYIVLDKLSSAVKCFEKVSNENIRAHWGLTLIQMLRGKLTTPPTYFEILSLIHI